MKILVVGGTRFFGIPMIAKLLEDGHEVTVATRGNAVNPFAGKTQQIIMDRTEPKQVKAALAGKTFDVIIDKVAYSSNDVRALLENADCRKYVQMSTCSVYEKEREGIREEEFDPASYPLKWQSRTEDYGEGKRLAERAALEYLNPADCVFVRYPIVLGENDYTGRLKFYVDHILDGIPMHVSGLDYGIAFIQEKEAGEFIAFLAERDASGPYNGSSEGWITTREIISYVESKSGKKAVLSDDGEEAPFNFMPDNESYDTSRAAGIGFRFSPLKNWIYDLLDFYMQR